MEWGKKGDHPCIQVLKHITNTHPIADLKVWYGAHFFDEEGTHGRPPIFQFKHSAHSQGSPFCVLKLFYFELLSMS